MEVVSVRRADGREASLSEIPKEQTFNTGAAVRAEEVVLSVPDGRSIRTLINATPIRAEGDEIGSVVVTMPDLAPLDETERMRTEFLGLVGHELRAPLLAIKSSADAGAGGGGRARSGRGPRVLPHHRRAGRPHARPHPRPARRGDALGRGGTLGGGRPGRGARSTFLGGGARHAVLVDLPADLPPVLADRRRIVQVLNNLFANAERHAPESTRIRVAAVREDAHVAVSVSDEGSGVAPELLPHLFSKHSGGRPGATAGHGLGLAVSKGLVEAHGGRIRAESPGAGRGATFTFTLPVAGEAGAAAAVRAAVTPTAPEPGEPPRILVVDDDPRALRFVRGALSEAGYAPPVTGAAHDVLRIIRTERPRLVLLDLMLPDADGIELMGQVPELADVPVIFISGYGSDEIVAKTLEAGAADYLVKPFSPTELVARIRAALRRREEPEPFVVGDLAIDYAQTPCDGPRRGGRPHRHGVRAAARALARRGTGRDLRDAATTGLGQAGERRREPRAELRQEPAAQARRKRVQPPTC